MTAATNKQLWDKIGLRLIPTHMTYIIYLFVLVMEYLLLLYRYPDMEFIYLCTKFTDRTPEGFGR